MYVYIYIYNIISNYSYIYIYIYVYTYIYTYTHIFYPFRVPGSLAGVTPLRPISLLTLSLLTLLDSNFQETSL